ncbi:PAS domain S-box protein [Salegentibacter holothuriorum]|nr:PAS domain S-box protein [Salegentibacter holothuriorum]
MSTNILFNCDPQRVKEVSRYNLSTNINEEDLNFLSSMAAEICKTKSALVSLIAQDTQWIKASHGMELEVREFPREFTFCNHTIANLNGVTIVEDAREDERFKNNSFVKGENPVIFYSGVPLINEKGFAVGTLCAVDSKPGKLSSLQQERLKKLSEQVMKSLELKRKTVELERLNDNLIQERKKYQYVTEGTETATFEWSIKKDKLVFNNVWQKLSGYEQAYFKGKGIEYWESLVHPEDIGMVQQRLKDHFNGDEKIFSCEFRFKHQTGKWIWISSQGKVFTWGRKNKPIKMYGLHQDVTIKKEKEFETLYRQNLLDALYQLSPLGIALNDYETGKFLEVNSKLVAPTGYSKKEFINLSYWDLTPEEYANSEAEQIKQLDKVGFYGPYEKEYIKSDGTRYPVLLKGVLTYDATGKKRIWSFVEDISERKQEEKVKEERLGRIQKLLNITENQNERLKNFAHIVSHNLRSHSSGISLLLEFLLDSHKSLNEDESFKHLKNASRNLDTTIQDLNEIVEVNISGQQNFQLVNLKTTVSRMIESVYAQLESENVCIQANIPEDLEIYGLRSYIESIVINFITNGIKYKSANRESYIHIEAKKDHIAQTINITFEDNGLGIDLNLHGDRLFKMYKTFHDHKDARGIGLFLTKNQVETMDGKIEVESKVDVGTKFTVKLPYEKN